MAPSRFAAVVFDLDGTLLDSDEALIEPFVALGVARDTITFGHPIAAECRRLGLAVGDYVNAYDVNAAQPFPGVEEMLAGVGAFSICSNKAAVSARAELDRLGWAPQVAMFNDDFGGEEKQLGPVLDQLGIPSAQVLFVGDTAHDRSCAAQAGTHFAWAGWNPRTGTDRTGTVLVRPEDLLTLLV